MLSRKYWIINCIILTLLAFSTFATTLAYAAPLGLSDKDWTYTNGNSWGWNYSPQTQINKDNVQDLEVKWVYPLGGVSTAPAGVQALGSLIEGTMTPPIVRNGVVYVITNSYVLYALDAKSGKMLWNHPYEKDFNTIKTRLPVLSGVAPHFHGINYWTSENVILLQGLACDIYAVDATSGKQKFSIDDLCVDTPGSIYKYPAGRMSQSTTGIMVYEKGRQLIYALSSLDGTGWVPTGRAVIMGIDIDTKKVLWRVFNQPPQGVPTKDWALQECNIGFFRNIPCSDVATKARENLEWDSAPAPGEAPFSGSGTTANWGQPSIDEDTGILYISTGNQLPWTNISQTRGPRLYGSTIMAIDMVAGKRIWWQQPMPRDPYDYDCNWGGILAENPKIGKVFVKGCKEGYWIVSDAATGKPLKIIQIIDELYPGMRTARMTDPLDRYDMIEWKWPDNSKYHGPAPFNLIPSFQEGAFATDQSYDPETSTIYHYASLMPAQITTLPLKEGSGSGAIISQRGPGNVTIVARDLATGNIKWKWFYATSNNRAFMVVSGGMVFSGFTDSTAKFFNKDTGKLLNTLTIGSPLMIGPTTGQDSDGKQKIFLVGGAFRMGVNNPQYGFGGVAATPGVVIALGLSDKASTAQASTVTTTQSTTVTSTSATTITESAGLPSEVTYAAVGVAVIALIAAAVLVMRKK